MNLRDPSERTALAGEYVLGTFDEHERRGFERQLEDDATLRAEVSRWHDRVLALASRLEPVPVGPGLWDEIEHDLLVAKAARETAERRQAFWQRLDVWQTIAGAAVALLVVLGAVLLLAWSSQRDVRLVALLEDPSGATSWVVEARARAGVRLRPVTPPPGAPALPRDGSLVAEFWTRLPGRDEQISLGTVATDDVAEVPASRLPGLVEGQTFGVTTRHLPASPEDAPADTTFTGKVVALPQ